MQVCTSELGAAAKLQEEFKKRGVQLVALSCNDLDSHKQVRSRGWGTKKTELRPDLDGNVGAVRRSSSSCVWRGSVRGCACFELAALRALRPAPARP